MATEYPVPPSGPLKPSSVTAKDAGWLTAGRGHIGVNPYREEAGCDRANVASFTGSNYSDQENAEGSAVYDEAELY